MPKYLQLPEVERINGLLDQVPAGDAVLHARIEPYSLKPSVSEKRLFKQLDARYASHEATATTSPAASAPASGLNSSPAVANANARQRRTSTTRSRAEFEAGQNDNGQFAAGQRAPVTLPSPHKRPRTLSSTSAGSSGNPGNAPATHASSPTMHPAVPSPSRKLTARAAAEEYSLDDDLDAGEPMAIVSPSWHSPTHVHLFGTSPLAHDSAMRKVFYHLIATLNAAFPDYDFTDVNPNTFRSVPLADVENALHTQVYAQDDHVRQVVERDLWQAVNEALEQSMNEAEVYVFSPSSEEDDPLHEEGTIWSHSVFFLHRKLKKVVLLKVRLQNPMAGNPDEDASDNENDVSFDIRASAAAVSHGALPTPQNRAQSQLIFDLDM
ncbi:hypothetical protein GGF31_008572 [Allomyces arbusculus]|nr:hypothetical protein GGF31_008572 [Allomyces arbusculus]